MDISWNAVDMAFRDEVRDFLEVSLTDELRSAGRLMTSVYPPHESSYEWQRILANRGWGAPTWPREYGGCDWTPLQRYIFARERIAAGAPPTPLGIQMCGPALIKFGTEEQKDFFLSRMLTGEHSWCQGYSEPESGSDLASLQMVAIEDGDELVCRGQKVWTTDAHCSNWMFCLVRSSRGQRPQMGITFLLIDMTSPGITVVPIVAPSGEHIQNQVFFDDVRVPKKNVVGEIGGGWNVAKYLLEFERGGTPYAPQLQARLDELTLAAEAAAGDWTVRLIDDPVFVAKIAAARVRLLALELYELRVMSQEGSPGTAASVMKILGTELSQHITELALEAAGHYGTAYQPQALRPGGNVVLPHGSVQEFVGPVSSALAPLRYLNDRAGTIYAGTNEIQRNILAKSLGL